MSLRVRGLRRDLARMGKREDAVRLRKLPGQGKKRRKCKKKKEWTKVKEFRSLKNYKRNIEVREDENRQMVFSKEMS